MNTKARYYVSLGLGVIGLLFLWKSIPLGLSSAERAGVTRTATSTIYKAATDVERQSAINFWQILGGAMFTAGMIGVLLPHASYDIADNEISIEEWQPDVRPEQ